MTKEKNIQKIKEINEIPNNLYNMAINYFNELFSVINEIDIKNKSIEFKIGLNDDELILYFKNDEVYFEISFFIDNDISIFSESKKYKIKIYADDLNIKTAVNVTVLSLIMENFE